MSSSYTVTQLTRHISRMFEQDELLSGVTVSGEISNFKHHSSGHMYFTLRDEQSVIKCVMFRNANARLRFRPADGMRVICHGAVSVYEAGGSYQLYPQRMEPDGIGDLWQAFERLKEKLEREGLFDPAAKRRLPALPARVAVVTSRTGAVIRDIRNVLFRRYPGIRLVLVPAAVQGADASASLIAGIRRVNRFAAADVIVLARGGGSLEDLWPFNDEGLAREIRRSAIPVVSAVGHETDFTIADFAADLRAPTPSAAAELIVPEYEALVSRLHAARERMDGGIRRRLRLERERLVRMSVRPALSDAAYPIRTLKAHLMRLRTGLDRAAALSAERSRHRLTAAIAKMEALSPMRVLLRGYAIATDEAGETVREIEQLPAGAGFTLSLRNGDLACRSEGPADGKRTASTESEETARWQ